VRLLGIGLRELLAWSAILASIGFAHRHLRAVDNPARRVLTQAIFPFYLVHQTIIVAVAHHLDPWQLPLGLEVAVLIGATVAGCWLVYDLGRRVSWLRPWIGLGPAKGAPDFKWPWERGSVPNGRAERRSPEDCC
jgi:peptidoglycan/LPS O-acetylase OafA/YrhL